MGPNRLAAIGNDAQGIKVWPIDVERVKVSPIQTELTGRVLDQAGQPIVGAKVELGPNRYTADSWMESSDLEIDGGGGKYDGQRRLIGPPVLKYQSITKRSRYPVVTTDAHGQFEFKGVKPIEYVLTVEAHGCAPQWRHINVGTEAQTHSQEFRLQAGRSVRGRVVDLEGNAVGGACVVLDKLHIHADPDGCFHWAIDAPVPDKVAVRVYRRYYAYKTFEGRLSPSQIEKQPIVLQLAK